MRTGHTLLWIMVVAIFGAVMLNPSEQSAGTKFETAGTVFRADPAFDAILPPGTKIEKLVTCCKWTEGPIWIHQGYLLFADIPDNRIMKWTTQGELSVFMQPSGYRGTAPYKGIEPGSNGMTLDRQGRLTVAGHAARNVWRMESLEKGAQITVLADRYEGKRLNSPNDLVYRSDGSLYFTDPPYGLETQDDKDPQKELAFNGVFRIRGATSQPPGAPADAKKLDLLIKDLTRPNGIGFSPGEKQLYIAVSDPARKIWMRYDVKSDGSLENGQVFYDATSNTEDGLPDGLKVDQKGNVYSAGPGGVWVFSPQGKHLGTIKPGEKVANCNWGDADGKTLYITASTSLYRVRLSNPGIRP
jgi:gluconolactonase